MSSQIALHTRCTTATFVCIVWRRAFVRQNRACRNYRLAQLPCSTAQSCCRVATAVRNGRRVSRMAVDGFASRRKTKDLNDAKEAARELYMDARYRVKHGIPAQSKRFKDVAKLAVDRMEKAMAAGEGRRVYRDYVQAINNYLIPFFGTHHVDHITYPLIQAVCGMACREDGQGTESEHDQYLQQRAQSHFR